MLQHNSSYMMVLGRISELVLRVSGAGSLASWYRTVLGMTEGGQLDSTTWTAKYPGQSVTLVFKVKRETQNHRGKPFNSIIRKEDYFWPH